MLLLLKALPETKANDTARLLSVPLTLRNEGFCFKFYYHMYGTTDNKLNVLLKNLGKFIRSF